ncbi:MAG: hypothetical protein LC789_06555 [Actinobacteria bacterium]|nr:hypothetical protein [Actinomycetota bacterium]
MTVRLTENAQSATQDVDFCEIPGTTNTPVGDTSSATNSPGTAFYYNGVVNSDPDAQNPTRPGAARFRQDYKPGTGITPDINGNNPGGEPDNADNTDRQTDDIFFSDYNTNPSGQDFARFRPNSSGQFRFGAVGLQPGGADILAFVDTQTPEEPSSFPPTRSTSEAVFTTGQLTFTNGGAAGSKEAAEAVTDLDAEPETDAAVVGTTQFFTALMTNNTGQTVAGVAPQVRVISGPNSSPLNQVRADCGPSSNNGVSSCAFQGRMTGTDTLVVFVNRTGGTSGPDSNEAQDTITRITTPVANQNPAAAYRVDLQPDTTTTTAGQPATFTAVITDANDVPVQGVVVSFTKTGPGNFAGGGSTATVTTGSTGRASVAVTSTAASAGQTQTITATIPINSTSCGQAGGSCTDTSTNTLVAGRSPTPTPSVTPSRSATPTATVSPTGTPSNTCRTVDVTVTTRTINATGLASVTAFGARPGSTVDLQGYSQDHFGSQGFFNDPTPVDRTGTADSSGSVTFSDLRPASNTRLRARMAGCTYTGNTDVIEVRAQETLTVQRTGARSYTFSGRSIPARPGGLIVSLYRITGLTFPPRDTNVRDEFVVKTGRDAQNAPGRSNVRSLLIF